MHFSPFFLLVYLEVNQGLQCVFVANIHPKFSIRISMNKAEMCGNAMRKPILEYLSGFYECFLKEDATDAKTECRLLEKV